MIDTLAETGSTNADLTARLRAGERVAEGNWLIADRQVSGRGRQGRQWFDGLGNFMGSTIVHIHRGDPTPASLALTTGLAVYETIVPLLADPTQLVLKWPNDLMLNGAKLSGILLEREGDAIVVGIGVNLAAAPELPDRQTIALSQCGPAPNRDHFAQTLAARFRDEIERWRNYGLAPIIRRWEAVAHAKGTELRVQPPGEEEITGIFSGLTEDGALALLLPGGEIRKIHAGDVMLAQERG